METEIKPVCVNCGREIKLLVYGRAQQWTHADMSGRECCTKYAEPIEGKDKH